MEYGGKIREGKKWSKKEKEKMKYVWSWILGKKYNWQVDDNGNSKCDNIDVCFNCGDKLKKIYGIEEILWNWMYVGTIYKIMCNECKRKAKNGHKINIDGYEINIG